MADEKKKVFKCRACDAVINDSDTECPECKVKFVGDALKQNNIDIAITAQGHVEKALDSVETLVKSKALDKKVESTLKDVLTDLSKVF